ncbi:MAG: glycosyl transferase group 1, partial [Bacilli bacterium]|nr:glycosyl transferase group 1 [Bacilli bacterium]
YLDTIRGSASRWMAAVLLHRLRQWDYAAAQRVDYFVANSTEVKARIRKYYGRDALVIHPPVDVLHPDQDGTGSASWAVGSSTGAGEYYLSLGRLVPYKRVDLAVLACTALGKRLIVAGYGPELGALRKLAGPTVEFVGAVPEVRKAALLACAQALLFCGEEDFGIVPVEACSVGTPVIGFGKGGLLDSVVPGLSGTLFQAQTVGAVMEAILQFEQMQFDPQLIKDEAKRFSPQAFQSKWTRLLASIAGKDGGDYAK